MANRATIQFRKFVNLDDNLEPVGEESYGVMVYDDYGSDYANFWTRETMLEEIVSPEQSFPETIIEWVSEAGLGEGVLNFVRENETGIEINGTWYEWEQIKGAFE